MFDLSNSNTRYTSRGSSSSNAMCKLMRSRLPHAFVSLAVVAAAFVTTASAQCAATAASGGSCGANGVCCPAGECCSQFGFCGVMATHCGAGCQPAFGSCSGSAPQITQPQAPQQVPVQQPSGRGVGGLISAQQWESMFPTRNNPPCHGASTQFYSLSAFLTAAASFPAFAASSDVTTNTRELAAFLAHISHETGALCWIIEGGAAGPPANSYCQSGQFPCAPGKSYHGRGPIQLSWNYNYAMAGNALGFDGTNNPDAVAADPVLAFRTALWFWMTPQSPKPSAHDVMAGRWTPSAADAAAGRTPGFGMVINIINGGLECGKGTPSRTEASRIRLYSSYCSLLGVSPDPNASCAAQQPYV